MLVQVEMALNIKIAGVGDSRWKQMTFREKVGGVVVRNQEDLTIIGCSDRTREKIPKRWLSVAGFLGRLNVSPVDSLQRRLD